MLRQTPPIEAAEAFLAATQAPSFRAAAATLALSPSAFSRRIQLLENFLGVKLFDHVLGRRKLTAIGRQYLAEVGPAIEAIQRASIAIRYPHQAGIRLATSHSLAAEWLMPRIARASDELGIPVEIIVTRDPAVLDEGRADLALWGGSQPADGGEIIVTLEAVPVVAESHVTDGTAPRSLSDLARFRMLGVRSPADGWLRWLSAAGYDGPARAVTFHDTNQLCYEAAASGMGIALGVPLLANRYLRDGRLRACQLRSVPTGLAYWLHHPRFGQVDGGRRRRIADWLKEEAHAGKHEFQKLTRALGHVDEG